MGTYPLISVIIPFRKKEEIEDLIGSLDFINYPKEKIEIITCQGSPPSRQRNLAAKKARGEILYFLDNDSVPDANLFKNVVYLFGEDVAAVGGPNLIPLNSSFKQELFDCALGSFFAHRSMACRYRQIGGIREVFENELIGCNLAVKRNLFAAFRGFNENLYPNEENELLNRFSKSGYKLLYNPEAVVFRHRRENFKRFIKQFVNYGRGRMEQIRVEKNIGGISYLLPVVLLFYLLSLPLIPFYLTTFHVFFLLPIFFYLLLSLISAAGFAKTKNHPSFILFLPLIYILMHVSYAVGLIRGIFTSLSQKATQNLSQSIKIETIKDFG